MSPPNDERIAPAGQFATTHWSMVLAAGRRGSTGSRRALAALCETYWYPLYAYVRRKGHSADEAADLAQEFFVHLLEKETLKVADQRRGRFRSFLLTAMNNFLAKQWRRATAQKRGGGRRLISLDFRDGESRYGMEPSHDLTAEKIYQRRWALTLLEAALDRLREEFERRGKIELFEQLRDFLVIDRSTVPYRQIAERLAMTEGAVKVAVHRLRRRCRELLREEIAQTVAEPEQIDDELRELFSAVQ